MRTIVASVVFVGFAAGLVMAADQTILGNRFTVKRPGPPPGPMDKRKVVFSAKEVASPNTIVGSPLTSGATLTLSAAGGSPTSQTFSLPGGYWTALGGLGYRYTDPTGASGAVRKLEIRKTPTGKFIIKGYASGRNGPLNVIPPSPGTSGCVLLTITNSGETYSVAFTTGIVKNRDGVTFGVKKPTAQATCVGAGTTTTTIATTTTTTTTTTTIPAYGSPSRAFMMVVESLLQ